MSISVKKDGKGAGPSGARRGLDPECEIENPLIDLQRIRAQGGPSMGLVGMGSGPTQRPRFGAAALDMQEQEAMGIRPRFGASGLELEEQEAMGIRPRFGASGLELEAQVERQSALLYDYDYDPDEKKMRMKEDLINPTPDPPAGDNDDRSAHKSMRWASVDDIEALGVFNDDAITYLRELPEQVYKHQEVGYHLRYFIEQEAEMNPEAFYTEVKEDLKEDLHYLVFKKDFAEKAVNHVANGIFRTQNSTFWATSFMENWIMYEQPGPFFKYKNSCRDIWFQTTYTPQYHHHNTVENSARTIQMLNVKEKEVSTSYDFWDNDRGEVRYFFHGTDWKSVDSIMRKGISLTAGTLGQDFSFGHCPGFYLSDTFESGLRWAKSKARFPAVIVYKVPSSLFSNDKHMTLTRENMDLLRRIYVYCRSSGMREHEVGDQVKDCLTITGPTFLNPGEINNPGVTPELSNDEVQTCVLDKDVAAKFDSHIHCVVYYEKKEL